MVESAQKRHWFWLTLALSSSTIVAVVFAIWELLEYQFFRNVDYVTLHYLYVSRGVVSSFLLAFWAAWFVLRERRHSEQELRHSREHYRRLLDVSPGAVALVDSSLTVVEWNLTAERLYGYSKDEVVGGHIPTITAETEQQLRAFITSTESGTPVLDQETRRRSRNGSDINVQLSLVTFREPGEPPLYLEVTHDIRERVRLRETLLQIEKLTTMGQMAAGTAHHLNTPLASMLLRLRMLRQHAPSTIQPDLEDFEKSTRYCQQFVRRLLDFSRSPESRKQPEALCHVMDSVLSFLGPQVLAKRARLSRDGAEVNGVQVNADRNQLEALFLILLSNSLDAISDDGTIAIRCHAAPDQTVVVEIQDNGCGIGAEHLPRIFEPFFTTKPAGKGTGLGLAIANNIVHEHGGSIRLDSCAGKGTTTYVQLPLFVPKLSHARSAP